MESEIWATLHTARIANAGFFIFTMFSIWVAARFSSVAVDKGVNLIGKIIMSLFALAVFAGNYSIGFTVMSSYTGHARAFQMLEETGVELSPMAVEFIDYFGTEAGPHPVMMVVGICGLLIALLPLWIKTSD